MAKKKRSKSTSDDPADRQRLEQPLQAVLLTEDWQGSSNYANNSTDIANKYHFYPLALDVPKVLCPLLNLTLIEYALNYLSGQNVEELYVVCVTEQVELYLKKLVKQYYHDNNMKILVIRDTTITNSGDALRELDKKNVIQSDPFVLMHGADIILNADLTDLIEVHRQRHTNDSSSIMTILFQSVGSASNNSQLRTTHDDLVVGIDPSQDGRILLYENLVDKNSVNIPCSFFNSHCSCLEIRTDLLDVGVDLCSPDVLARFSDEFDYRNIRQEFVTNSVAEEEEGLQNKLFGVVLPNSTYAARIRDFQTYHRVSRDLLRRYAYPLVPDNPPDAHHHHNDNNILVKSSGSGAATTGTTDAPAPPPPGDREDQYEYTRQRQYLYMETTGKTRIIGGRRSTTWKGPGLLGKHVFINSNCYIQNSVIGDYCHIGKDCTIIDCHLWEGVQIEDGAKVTRSVLAAGVIVKAGAIVPKGCILGEDVVVGTNNAKLKPYTRITCCANWDDDGHDDSDWDDEDDDGQNNGHPEDEDDSDGDNKPRADEKQEGLAWDVDVVGLDGKGRVWRPQVDEDDDSEDEEDNVDDQENLVPGLDEILKSQCIGFVPTSIFTKRSAMQKEDDDSFSVEESPEEAFGTGDYDEADVTFGEIPVSSSQPTVTVLGRQEGVDVVKELTHICLEFESTTSPIENLAIELNSYKFSQNASYSDCTMAATLAIVEKMSITKDMSDGKLVAEFKSYLDTWAPLLQKMSIGLDEEKAIILALEQSAVGEDDKGNETSEKLSAGMSFRLLLQMLHDQEIVSEESILAWAADRKEEDGDKDTPKGKLFRLQPVQEFLEWLDEESEEDDDDSDDSEDDEE